MNSKTRTLASNSVVIMLVISATALIIAGCTAPVPGSESIGAAGNSGQAMKRPTVGPPVHDEEPTSGATEPVPPATVTRTNFNATFENLVLIHAGSDRNGGLHSQLFLNNLDYIESISVAVGGRVTWPRDDTLTLVFSDGCGNELKRQSVPLDVAGLTSPTSRKWVEVPVGLALDYGRYYYFTVSTLGGNTVTAAQVLLNTDRYGWGRYVNEAASALVYPNKKQDIVFSMFGRVAASKPWYPTASSNIVCPERCRLVRSEEKTVHHASQHFNVIVQERTANGQGSFWADYTHGAIDQLRSDILTMLEGTPQEPGVRETRPFDAFYDNMNFYIAIEDPAQDSRAQRGFKYCANIDARILVVTGDQPYGGCCFTGEVNRPVWNDHAWGAKMRRILVHELLGHGIGSLTDEYIANGLPVTNHRLFSMNSDEIGCPSWCDAYQDIGAVETGLASRCWTLDAAACQGDSSCWYVGSIAPPVPYFQDKTCIPKAIKGYDIGLQCMGNSRCYIGAPYGTTGKVVLNVAQPNSRIMQSFHAKPTAPGFSTAVEESLRTLMECMFPLTCGQYDYATCNAFQSRWNGSDPRNVAFAKFGNACENGYYRRR